MCFYVFCNVKFFVPDCFGISNSLTFVVFLNITIDFCLLVFFFVLEEIREKEFSSGGDFKLMAQCFN